MARTLDNDAAHLFVFVRQRHFKQWNDKLIGEISCPSSSFGQTVCPAEIEAIVNTKNPAQTSPHVDVAFQFFFGSSANTKFLLKIQIFGLLLVNT